MKARAETEVSQKSSAKTGHRASPTSKTRFYVGVAVDLVSVREIERTASESDREGTKRDREREKEREKRVRAEEMHRGEENERSKDEDRRGGAISRGME